MDLRLSSISTKYCLARVIIIEVVIDMPSLSLLLDDSSDKYCIYVMYGVISFCGVAYLLVRLYTSLSFEI